MSLASKGFFSSALKGQSGPFRAHCALSKMKRRKMGDTTPTKIKQLFLALQRQRIHHFGKVDRHRSHHQGHRRGAVYTVHRKKNYPANV